MNKLSKINDFLSSRLKIQVISFSLNHYLNQKFDFLWE